MEYEIIDFVKVHPVLYQRKYAALQYAAQKMEKWRELGRLLKRDPNAVRLRWKSLRDNYRKQMIKKSKEQRDGEDVIGHGNFSKYYNHMTFLNSEYRLDSEEHTTQRSVGEASCTTQSLNIKPTKTEIEDYYFAEYIEKLDATSPVVEDNANKNITIDSEEPIQSKRIRANKDVIITEACEEMAAILKCTKQIFLKPTQSQVFFNSVALSVEQAQMPAMDLMRLQQKIMELITQELLLHQEQANNLK